MFQLKLSSARLTLRPFNPSFAARLCSFSWNSMAKAKKHSHSGLEDSSLYFMTKNSKIKAVKEYTAFSVERNEFLVMRSKYLNRLWMDCNEIWYMIGCTWLPAFLNQSVQGFKNHCSPAILYFIPTYCTTPYPSHHYQEMQLKVSIIHMLALIYHHQRLQTAGDPVLSPIFLLAYYIFSSTLLKCNIEVLFLSTPIFSFL